MNGPDPQLSRIIFTQNWVRAADVINNKSLIFVSDDGSNVYLHRADLATFKEYIEPLIFVASTDDFKYVNQSF